MSSYVIKVLFVCMGNICRSPAAECFFREALKNRKNAPLFEIKSAGTGGWHVGAKPDRRMRAAAKKQGLIIEGSARQVAVEDFSKFDWIFCMDRDNLDDLLGMGANADTTKLLLPFIHHETLDEVPDPYYGGEDGFENVVRLIHEATTQLALKLCD